MQTRSHKKTMKEAACESPLAENISRGHNVDVGCNDPDPDGMPRDRKLLSDPATGPVGHAPQREAKSYSDEELHKMRPTQLAEYITFRYHADMWKNLPVVHDLLISVIRTHGQEHDELTDLLKLVGKLRTDVEGHLLDEETNVFPTLSKNDEETRKDREPEVEHLVEEHEETENLLKKIRKTAKDFEVPDDANDEYRRLYAMLPDMEKETLEHYHVENDILFPEIATK